MANETETADRQANAEVKALIVRAALLAVVAGGCWYGLARPLVTRVLEQRASLRAMEQTLNDNAAADISEADLRSVHQELTERVARIEDWSLRPEASGKLYESFRNLAKRTTVRIERIEPKGESVLGTGVKPKDGEVQPVAGRAIGYTLEVSGTYEAVARFIASCETELGSSRVVSFRISPSARGLNAGAALVVATLDTQHICLKFDHGETPAKTANVGGTQ